MLNLKNSKKPAKSQQKASKKPAKSQQKASKKPAMHKICQQCESISYIFHQKCLKLTDSQEYVV